MLDQAGVISAQTAAFFSATRATAPRPLPSAAICISRFNLDAALAGRFRTLGGDLLESSRFAGDFAEGVIRATGRRARAGTGGSQWFGLKIHARNVVLDAGLEMHLSAQGYVGLCKISADEVNICGLFRKMPGANSDATGGRELLRGRPGSALHRRLAAAVFDEASFCAIAGLSLQPQQAAVHAEICIGDTITMIPPVTGNGMSMAFESAELAIAPLTAWSRGTCSWPEARQKIARECDAVFARRLAWAKWMQRIILTPALQNPLLALAARSDRFWRLAFERTR